MTDLYRMYGPVIYARCARLLRDDAAAEDATQETFLRVYRHLDRAPDGREALAWIYRIATNYCLNEIRNRNHRPEPTVDLPEPRVAGDEDLLANRELVAQLIDRAPPKVRIVAWLHHMDGLDHAEIARVAQVSRRSVVNHLATFATNARKYAQRAAG